MTKTKSIFLCFCLVAAVITRLFSQNIYISFTNNTQVQYPLAQVHSITFSNNNMNLNMVSGSVNSWPTASINYYNYTGFTAINSPASDLNNNLQIFPNPCSGVMHISYNAIKPCEVSIRFIGLSGQVLRSVTQAENTAGWHNFEWDCKAENGARLADGVYLCRVSLGDAVITRKIFIAN